LLLLEAATWSIHQKPALWRVASYLSPGLPKPTNNLIPLIVYLITLSANRTNEKRAL